MERPKSDPNLLTQAEADEYRRQLALISDDSLRKEYSQFWKACELRPKYIPRPPIIQRMLIAWKCLWRREELRRSLEKPSPGPKGIAPDEYETPL